MTVTWTYDKDRFDASWGVPEMRIRFNVDPLRGSDDMAKDPIVDHAIATVAEKSIVNPSGAVAASPRGRRGPAGRERQSVGSRGRHRSARRRASATGSRPRPRSPPPRARCSKS